MKKLISCLLAVLLVCSLMSMNVFAAKTPVVGNNPDNGDVNDGVNDFTSSNGNGANADINVNFGQTTTKPGTGDTNGDGKVDENDKEVVGGNANNTIVHKYAVDITYSEFLLDLNELNFGDANVKLPAEEDLNGDGDTTNDVVAGPFYMVWDVNNYKYVLCGKDATTGEYIPVDIENADDGVKNEETGAIEGENGVADVLETPFKLDSTVMVTNHSDLSVFTKLVLTNDRTDIAWEVTAADGTGEKTADISDPTAAGNAQDTATATEEITKAKAETTAADGTVTAGSATNGSTYSFTATPAAADGWLGVIGNLLNETSTVRIGNITVTIAPNAIA